MSTDPGTPDELTLISYEKLTDHGFALPCFGQARGANTVYIARSTRPGDPAAPIAAFDLYDSEGLRPLSADKERHGVKVGSPWVDVFLWHGETYLGTKSEIWLAIGGIRSEIEASAPLTLLNLAEGVPGEATDHLARTAFAWLEGRYGTKLAAHWQLESYLRSLAIRGLRHKLEDAADAGHLRRELRNVELARSGSTLTLHLPATINKNSRITLSSLGELVRAAQAFGFQTVIADEAAPTPEKPATRVPAAREILVMRLRKGRGGTQTQIPFRVVKTFFKGETKIRSGHSGHVRAMTPSLSSGSPNTMKLQVPEMKTLSFPVARFERTPEGAVYHVYDSDSPLGKEIIQILEEGRRNGTTQVTRRGPEGTWWREV
jgi:hypothetical protein